MPASKFAPPRENLFRAVYALPASAADAEPSRALELRDATSGTGRTLQLQWSVANQWTEIDSWYEGNFMERIAPGAATKTIRENSANMRILLQHGRDPQLGEKPIAPIDLVEENEVGGYAEGRLFDGLDPLVVDGLRAGQYGASFRFRVMREELVEDPGVSDHNPKGIPERTIKEMAVQEFGPVTWGAYGQASAGVRSITDEVHFATLRDIPQERLAELARFWEGERMDSEDVGTIAQMLTLAAEYIADQDESDEQSNVTQMESVQATLIELLTVEAVEDEPAEDEDEELSAPVEGETRRAEQDTPSTTEAPPATGTPKVERDFLQEGEMPDWFLS